MSDSATLARGVAAWGLPGASSLPRAPLGPSTFDDLLARAVDERITGILLACIEGEGLAATQAQRAAVQEAHEEVLAVDLVLERLLVDTSLRFAAAGIGHRALKGPVVGRTAYPDPSLRSFRDIDVLVEAARFDDAVALLVGRGGRARFLEPRARFTSRFGKGVCVTTAEELEVDVHRVFVAGPFGLAIEPADLFAGSASVVIGGAEVPVMGTTECFLHSCYHAALGDVPPRLSAVRDVAQFATTVTLDVDDVVRVAQRWRGRAVVQHALRLTRSQLTPALDGPLYDWALGYRPDRFELTSLRVYATPTAGYAAKAAAGLWAIPGYRARAAYARALLMPSRAYLRQRDGGYGRRLRRGVRIVRTWKAAP